MARFVIMLQIIHAVSCRGNKRVAQKIIHLLITKKKLYTKKRRSLILDFSSKSKSLSLTLLEYFYPSLHVSVSEKERRNRVNNISQVNSTSSLYKKETKFRLEIRFRKTEL